MGTILLATDFSKTSEKAYPLAAELAKKTDSKLLLVHILPHLLVDFAGAISAIPVEALLENDIKAIESEFTLHLNKEVFKGIEIEKLLVAESNYNLLATFNEVEEQHEASLLIIGTDGVRSSHKSLAAKLVKVSAVPVITVGESVDNTKIEKITLATNFENVNYKFLDNIWNIQKAFDAHLQILFVNTPLNFKETQVIENEYELFVNNYELDNLSLHVYNAHQIEDGILKFVENENTDLLVLSTHGRKGLSDLLQKSYASYVVGHAKVPVYVYNMYNDKVYYNTISNIGLGSYYA